MSRVTANGIAFEVTERGKGRPLVLVHGVLGSGRFFDRQLDHFARAYRVIVPDLRGHGESDKPLDGHTVANYADDMHALMDELKVERPVIVGWSMGSMIAYEYLQRQRRRDGRAEATR